MKHMTPDQMRKAMIEITLNKKSSRLKKDYPDEYLELQKEINEIKRSGMVVEIPE